MTITEISQQLQNRTPLPPLFPTQIYDAQTSRFLLSPKLKMSDGERAGWLMLNDDLHACHEIVQSLDNASGSFWHAIMHRREGDAGNSLYWWRRTGIHPAFAPLYEAACKYLQTETDAQAQSFLAQMQTANRWNPSDFVRAGERNRGDENWLQKLQLLEMQTLLNWCRDNAA